MPVVWTGYTDFSYAPPFPTTAPSTFTFTLNFPPIDYEDTPFIIIAIPSSFTTAQTYLSNAIPLTAVSIIWADSTVTSLNVQAVNPGILYYNSKLRDGGTVSVTIRYNVNSTDVEALNDLYTDGILFAALLDVKTRIYYDTAQLITFTFPTYDSSNDELYTIYTNTLNYNAGSFTPLSSNQFLRGYFSLPSGSTNLEVNTPIVLYSSGGSQFTSSSSITFVNTIIFPGSSLSVGVISTSIGGVHNPIGLTVQFRTPDAANTLISSFSGSCPVGNSRYFVDNIIPDSGILVSNNKATRVVVILSAPLGTTDIGSCQTIFRGARDASWLTEVSAGQVAKFDLSIGSWLRTITSVTDNYHLSIDAPINTTNLGQIDYRNTNVTVPSPTTVNALVDIPVRVWHVPNNVTTNRPPVTGYFNSFTDQMIVEIKNSSGNGINLTYQTVIRPTPGSSVGEIIRFTGTIADGQSVFNADNPGGGFEGYYWNVRISNASGLSGQTSVILTPYNGSTANSVSPLRARPQSYISSPSIQNAPASNGLWLDEATVTNGTAQIALASFHSSTSTEAITSGYTTGDVTPLPILTSAVQPLINNFTTKIRNQTNVSTTLFCTGSSNNTSTLATGIAGVQTPVPSGVLYYPVPAALLVDPEVSFGKVVGPPGDFSNSTLAALGLTSDGFVYFWGRNGVANRQLWAGSSDPAFINAAINRAQRIPTLSNIVDIDFMADGAIALDAAGNVWGWGANQFGDLGTGLFTGFGPGSGPPQSSVVYPDPFIIASGIKAISTSSFAILLTTTGGQVLVAGGSGGGTGVGTVSPANSSLTLTLIPGLSGVKKAYGGGLFSVFLMNDGTVKGCGGGFSNNPSSGWSLAGTVPLNTIFDIPEIGGEIADISPTSMLDVVNFSSSRPTIWLLTNSGIMQLHGYYSSTWGTQGDGTFHGAGNGIFTTPNPIVLPPGVTCARLPRYGAGNAGSAGFPTSKDSAWMGACIGSDGLLYTWGYNANNNLGWPTFTFNDQTPHPTPTPVLNTPLATSAGPTTSLLYFTTGPTPAIAPIGSLSSPQVLG